MSYQSSPLQQDYKISPPKKLEAVIVCVNYSDFLAFTLPSTRTVFDQLVVVTDTSDTKTKDLCDYYNVRCVQTDVFYEDDDTFNKGKGINEGLKALDKDGWVVHLDADIYLPPRTRDIINNIPLDPRKIYGADRLMCPDFDSWVRYLANPGPMQDSWVYIHLSCFPVGVRIAEYYNTNCGYEPIGYFQMWNPAQTGIESYPTEHGFADRTDVIFCKYWPRPLRELLPELVLIHLESSSEMGCNWGGRKSPFFGPPPAKKRSCMFKKLFKGV